MTHARSVSVVVATFNRPDTLEVAVASALAQSVPLLEIIVVGDACDRRTAGMLTSLAGPIRYVNLPRRHGEQSIPNSAGSALARGDVIAYLNHDDVWLPHHIETSLAALDRTDRHWHLGAAAFGERSPAAADDGPITFSDRTPPGRSIGVAFSRANRYLEPVSSWVVDRQALEDIGWWRPARLLYRTPTQDLALRLWRRVGEPAVSDEITVLKSSKRLRPKGRRSRSLTYAGEAFGFAWLGDLVEQARADGGEALCRATALVPGWSRDRCPHVSEDPLGASPRAVTMARRLVGSRAAALYRHTGIDLLDTILWVFGTPRGQMLGRMLRRRTGEDGLPDADLSEAITYAKGAAGRLGSRQ